MHAVVCRAQKDRLVLPQLVDADLHLATQSHEQSLDQPFLVGQQAEVGHDRFGFFFLRLGYLA